MELLLLEVRKLKHFDMHSFEVDMNAELLKKRPSRKATLSAEIARCIKHNQAALDTIISGVQLIVDAFLVDDKILGCALQRQSELAVLDAAFG